ncbi:OLC1v1014854C1 [Oldenlandia corymbosa var. corymbosa]|uniref:CASP-like protein n=1 Tax=Oldenlandia corymbosa var. corymbosa TaxID=529605 RepID=A0AAV1E5K1_OLDCO|nr:OLC1v1014854C1 [Oldenlandia corymbosa var. corymbosa]
MMNGGNNSNTGEVNIQLPETAKMGGAPTSVTMSGPLVSSSRPSVRSVHGKMDIAHVVLRLACLLTSVTSLAVMITAKQASTISLYGFSLPVSSKWSFSDSLEYLVGVSAAAAVHSLLQLFISGSRSLRKSPVIPSRNHAWLLFVGDQIFAFAMMSAGSAASGVTNLNRTGIRHSALPNFCKPLNVFCNRVAVSIVFVFFSCFLLAISVVLDVIWLSKY